MPLIQIWSALLYGVAGFLVFLILLNRRLILRPDGRAKALLSLLFLIGLTGGGAWLGFFLHRLPWILVPLALLCLVLLGEARRVIIRRFYAGTRSVGTVPHKVDITKPITTTDLVVHRYEVTHPKWNGKLLRIVHLSDLHVHHDLPLAYYQDALAIAEQSKPDIAVFTGDFIAGLDTLPKLREVLRPIAKLESYAVLGNHDYWADADAVRKVVHDSGLHLLSGESIVLPVGDEKILINGYDYPWNINKKGSLPQGNCRSPLSVIDRPFFKARANEKGSLPQGNCRSPLSVIDRPFFKARANEKGSLPQGNCRSPLSVIDRLFFKARAGSADPADSSLIPNAIVQESNMLHIVLSHTPDNIYWLSKSYADFVFSGHYHAGQFRIPVLGPIVIPSIYGRRFDHGHFIVNGTHLFVTSGIGVAAPPLRIYCQPDIFIVDIVAGNYSLPTQM